MSAPRPVVVVGGGIAGLAAADRLATSLGPARVILLEAAARLGGKIATERRDGFVIEGGPDCFLATKPAGLALARELRIGLGGTNPAVRRSFVRRAGRLHALPEGITGLVPSRLGPLLTTRLLSVPGRLRAGLEALLPPRATGIEETLAGFVTRRFGIEAWRWLVEPLLSGIYAGDGEALSLQATFPHLADLERTHGSVLRAMLAARRRGAVQGAPGSGAPSPTPFVTPEGGLGTMVAALERRLAGCDVRTGVTLRALRREGGTFQLALSDGAVLAADAVVLATPAYAAAAAVADLDPALANLLAGIPFVSVATVSVALPRAAVPRALEGYGYVIPRADGGPVVACTWTSSKFPDRAPPGFALLRYFLGRAGAEEVVAADDAALRAVVREELARVLGVRTEPALWRIHRWPRAMPQYVLGHLARVEAITRRLLELPGLDLAGASYRGVGLPDCIASGWAAADRVAPRARSRAA